MKASAPQLNMKYFPFSLFVRIIWYSLIAGVVVFYFKQNIVTHPQVNLSLQTARPELIQVFCDTGKGYNEAESSNNKTTAAQQKGEQFSMLIPGACKRLRLDLGEAGANIKISTANIITSSGDRIDVLGRILAPSSLNEIKGSETNQGEFIATANDPYVVLSGDLTSLTTSGYSIAAILKMIGIFIIVFGVAAASDYWANKEEK